MKNKKGMEKPDFEKLAYNFLGEVTEYGNRNAPIGSGKRSYYETQVTGFVKGCNKVWDDYVESLEEDINDLNKKLELSNNKELLDDMVQLATIELKQENSVLLNALKEAQKCMDYLGDILDNHDMIIEEDEKFVNPIFDLVDETITKFDPDYIIKYNKSTIDEIISTIDKILMKIN